MQQFNLYGSVKCPCHDCKSRKIGCHAGCTLYNKYQKEIDEIRNEKIREGNENVDIYQIGNKIRKGWMERWGKTPNNP